MRRLIPILGVWSLSAAVLVMACGKDPATPTGPTGGPASGGSTVAVSLEIAGPVTVPPGTPAQFKAILTLADRSTRDVTNEAQWRSNSIDMTVTGPGLVAAQRTSEAMLTAAYAGLTSTVEVIFVPDGTFRLKGIIRDPMPPSGPVQNAQIVVVSGTGRDVRSGTTEQGHYTLRGVAGRIELRITKDGYHTRTDQLTVTEHTTRDIEILPLAAAPDVSGNYTLTISAADICSTSLPADAMVRTYSAKLEQVGPALTITAGGATFAKVHGWFEAKYIRNAVVEPHRVWMSFGTLGCSGYYYGCGPSVLEQVGTNRYFLPSGDASLQIFPNTLSGEINGTIEIHEGNAVPGVVRTASCKSTRHRITFTR